MNDYRQPAFYRFNEDSLKLVSEVSFSERIPKQILDIGAGCGIIGIELARRFPSAGLTLLEPQADFLPYLHENREVFLPGREVSIRQDSIGRWQTDQVFDLIVSNPPYYLVGHGEIGGDERRTIARTFVLEGWQPLLTRISGLLSIEGQAFLVIKNDPRILGEVNRYGRNLQISTSIKKDLCFLKLTRLNVD